MHPLHGFDHQQQTASVYTQTPGVRASTAGPAGASPLPGAGPRSATAAGRPERQRAGPHGGRPARQPAPSPAVSGTRAATDRGCPPGPSATATSGCRRTGPPATATSGGRRGPPTAHPHRLPRTGPLREHPAAGQRGLQPGDLPGGEGRPGCQGQPRRVCYRPPPLDRVAAAGAL